VLRANPRDNHIVIEPGGCLPSGNFFGLRMSSSFKGLPSALERWRDKPVWVNWKRKRKGSGFTKPPYQPSNPRLLAEPDNPATWGTFDVAFANYKNGKADGVGICLLGTEGLVGIDGDDCIRDDGTFEPAAVKLIQRCSSYTELSPSQR